MRAKCVRHGSRAKLTRVHTIVAIVDVDGVAVVQPLEGTRKVDVEVKIGFVLGLVDPLEAADDVLMYVISERLGGLDLVVGGCVEVKDPGGGGEDLVI